jgi:hypothetical protein
MPESADERLVVMLEARVTEFEKRMRSAERTGTDSYRRMRTGSRTATRQMEQDMVRSTSRINQALASTSSQIGSFAKSFAVGFAGGAIAAVFAGISNSAAETVKQLAELGDEAKRAGVSVEAFQEWKYVAEQNRIGIDALTDGLKELSLRTDEFVTTGSGSASEGFQRLGYSARELKEKLKDPSALMLEIIGRMEGLDKAAQIRISDELFGGTGGEQFVQLLDQGAAGIQDQIDRARELGIVIDADMIAKAAELNAKFGEVSARMKSIWQTGVVEAALFFGLIESEKEKLKFDPIDTKRLLGAGTSDALGGLPEVPQDALVQIENLKTEYADLAKEARLLVPALSDASSMMRGLGDEAAAQSLTDLATRIGDAARAFEKGDISGEQYAKRLREVVTEAQKSLTAMSELDQARLAGVIGQVSALLDWIRLIPGAAAAARNEINALTQMDTGTPLTSTDGNMPPEPDSQLAPSATPRPKRAPNDPDFGVPDAPKASGGKGGGGGAKSSGRIDSLIAELQTEEEIVTEWYSKALDLLNGATEAQLAAIGGKHEAIERLEKEHAERLAAIDTAKNSLTLESALGAGADILGAIGSTNKKALKISQSFAAAEAFISAYKGAAKELEKGVLGFPTAALVVAKGAAFAAAIMGTSENGRGGGGGGGSASPASSPSPAAAPESPLRVSLDRLDPSAIYSGAAIQKMFEAIQKEAGNRGIVWVAT